MVSVEDILRLMDERAKSVCSRTYLQERPNAVTSPLKEFIVVSIPYSESRKTIGADDWWLDQTVCFEIYVADRKTAENPKDFNQPSMKRLRSAVYSLFPIIDTTLGVKITTPRTVIPASSDGNGYHYTRIQGKMTTMV